MIASGRTRSFYHGVSLLVILVGIVLVFGCSPREEPSAPEAGEPEGKVERVEGDALVIRGGEGTPVHLHLGDSLFRGDVVITEGTGSLEFRLVDGSVLMLRPGSRLKINARGAGDVEAPSVMLYWGRLLSRALAAVGEDRFFVDTPTLVAGVRGTEFEVAIAEDQGALAAVYHGKVEVEAEGEKVVLGPQKEIEAEFMERPTPPRNFKEKIEADWAAWMAARARNLPNRLPDLVVRMERRLRETPQRREEERASVARRIDEMQAVARSIEELGNRGDPQRRQELVRQFQDLSSAHRQSIKRLQQLENRAEAAYVHAERLQKRAKGMKKELGNRYRTVTDGLKRIQDSRKAMSKGFAEDRAFLEEHRKKSGSLLDAIPEAKAVPAVSREKESRSPSQKEKTGASQVQKGSLPKGDPRLVGKRPPPPAGGKSSVSKDRGAGAGAGSGQSKVQKAPEKKKPEIGAGAGSGQSKARVQPEQRAPQSKLGPKKEGAETKGKYYEVKKGDNLWSISRRTGVSAETLRELNKLQDSKLQVGQKLLLAR